MTGRRRPQPTEPPGSWLELGTCAQLGALVWDQLDEAEQLGACVGCPVLDPCRRWAAQHSWQETVVAGWIAPHRDLGRPPPCDTTSPVESTGPTDTQDPEEDQHMTATTSTTPEEEFLVPEHLAPYYREPSGDEVTAIHRDRGDWAARLDVARQNALGVASMRKAEHDRDEAARAAADAIKCEVCGQGYAVLGTFLSIPGLGPFDPSNYTITSHPRCRDDVIAAVAERRCKTNAARIGKLIDRLGIEVS